MKLSDWITAAGITHAEAARRCGVAHTTIARWCAGALFPSRENMRVIRRVTHGEVTPNDFVQAEGGEAA